jgi:hypothetical protein
MIFDFESMPLSDHRPEPNSMGKWELYPEVIRRKGKNTEIELNPQMETNLFHINFHINMDYYQYHKIDLRPINFTDTLDIAINKLQRCLEFGIPRNCIGFIVSRLTWTRQLDWIISLGVWTNKGGPVILDPFEYGLFPWNDDRWIWGQFQRTYYRVQWYPEWRQVDNERIRCSYPRYSQANKRSGYDCPDFSEAEAAYGEISPH